MPLVQIPLQKAKGLLDRAKGHAQTPDASERSLGCLQIWTHFIYDFEPGHPCFFL